MAIVKPVEERTDFNGVTYPTVKDMCKAFGVNYSCYLTRRQKRGWTVKDSLLGKSSRVTRIAEADRTDIQGRVFNNQKEMCEANGVNYSTFLGNIKRYGMTAQEALVAAPRRKPSKEDRTDHVGETYGSVSEMCRKYGIRIDTYQFRLASGMSKEEALTTPIKSYSIVDFNGLEHNSWKAACSYYKVSYSYFTSSTSKRLNRTSDKMKILKALVISKSISVLDTIEEIYSDDSHSYYYYKGVNKSQEEVLSEDELLNLYTKVLRNT